MKTKLLILSSLFVGLSLMTANAQFGPRGGGMGGSPPGPRLAGGDMAKIFGEHSAFSSELEFHIGSGNDEITMPGKVACLNGKSRFEMNLSEMKNPKMREDMTQMKAMGMDQTVMISRPDKKTSYRVYPGMRAYLEDPAQDAKTGTSEADYKIEVTELGKETVDGHPCIKNKVVLTDKDGKTHESTVWNATDLKKFPVKIQSVEAGSSTVMIFKNVKLEKPDAAQFELPTNFKKHDSFMSMIMEKMGGMGVPAGPDPLR